MHMIHFRAEKVTGCFAKSCCALIAFNRCCSRCCSFCCSMTSSRVLSSLTSVRSASSILVRLPPSMSDKFKALRFNVCDCKAELCLRSCNDEAERFRGFEDILGRLVKEGKESAVRSMGECADTVGISRGETAVSVPKRLRNEDVRLFEGRAGREVVRRVVGVPAMRSGFGTSRGYVGRGKLGGSRCREKG